MRNLDIVMLAFTGEKRWAIARRYGISISLLNRIVWDFGMAKKREARSEGKAKADS